MTVQDWIRKGRDSIGPPIAAAELMHAARDLLGTEAWAEFRKRSSRPRAAPPVKPAQTMLLETNVLDGLDIPFCVASSGIPEKLQLTLGMEKPKPFPDVFLHAARTCGVPPSRCAVVEDTATGVAAGVAAAMTVFGYCALTPARLLREAGAHYVINAMSDLPRLLATT